MSEKIAGSLAEIAAGDPGAAEAFVNYFRPILEIHLYSRAKGATSRQFAESTISDVLADCCAVGSDRVGLLSKYSGSGNLEGWVKKVTLFRYLNLVKREQRLEGIEDAEGDVAPAVQALLQVVDEESDSVGEILRDAVEAAFAWMEVNSPRNLVLMKLSFLHGVMKKRLASAWDRDPGRITRYVQEGLEEMRSQILVHVHAVDPKLELRWSDFLILAQHHAKLTRGIF